MSARCSGADVDGSDPLFCRGPSEKEISDGSENTLNFTLPVDPETFCQSPSFIKREKYTWSGKYPMLGCLSDIPLN